jgi:energy-coupling factor transporter ATP-binding protein EcfA2
MPSRLDNRPLLGTIDRDLFLPPSILPELEAAAKRRLNVLVLGERGSGKTTLLRALEVDLNTEERPPVYVDLHPAQDAAQALALIAEALGQKWQRFGDSLSEERTRSALARERIEQTGTLADPFRWRLIPVESATGSLLRLARTLGQAPASMILVDSPPGEGAAHTLFGRLRDELWQQGHQWVVAADDVLRDELTRPPASAFFDVQLDLVPLSTSEQREFLAKRMSSEPGVDIDALVDQTDGLPRSMLELAREAVLSSRPVDELLARREEIRERLSKLPPTAATIVGYLTDHGATSASDPELLGTLGVSAQRARQVLAQLEDDGLVRSFPEQQERRGRPRKLYELRELVR